MPTALHGDTTVTAPVLHEVRSFIVETFLLGRDSGFGNDESLLESGIIDSTGIMLVVSFLEERFAIAVADEDLTSDNLETAARIAGFVDRRLARRHAA